jgi:hypothetical protein
VGGLDEGEDMVVAKGVGDRSVVVLELVVVVVDGGRELDKWFVCSVDERDIDFARRGSYLYT